MAIDGKALRGSKASKDGSGAQHLLSVYATEAGLVPAQQAFDSKSNEVTAIPALLDMPNLEGAIVTIDAMGTQKTIEQYVPSTLQCGHQTGQTKMIQRNGQNERAKRRYLNFVEAARQSARHPCRTA